MIKEKDLLEAIAECQGVRNPNAVTCRNLAAFYTIYDHLYGNVEAKAANETAVAQPEEDSIVKQYGESEFLKRIAGMDEKDAWLLMDELMMTLQVLDSKLYNQVLNRI